MTVFGSMATSCKKDLIPYLDNICEIIYKVANLKLTPQNTATVSESFRSNIPYNLKL